MTEKQPITDEMRNQLRMPFPDEAISQHPSKSFLSTIKAIYIVERLNDVFGLGGWTVVHNIVNDADDYVSVSGYIHIYPPYDISTPTQYGGHQKTGKNVEPADGYKSAVTDLQSKCASYLEIGIDVFKGLVKPKQKNYRPPVAHPKNVENPQPDSSDVPGGDFPTEKQKNFLNSKMKKSGLATSSLRKQFYDFVLSNSDDGETRRWISDFLDQYDGYFQTYQDSIADKIA